MTSAHSFLIDLNGQNFFCENNLSFQLKINGTYKNREDEF